jgi:hypothetical protein
MLRSGDIIEQPEEVSDLRLDRFVRIRGGIIDDIVVAPDLIGEDCYVAHMAGFLRAAS